MSPKERLTKQIEEIAELSKLERFCPEFNVWKKVTVRLLISIFWESSYEVTDFNSIQYSPGIYSSSTTEGSLDIRYAKWLSEARFLLIWFEAQLNDHQIDQVYSDFWQLFNPKIIQVSKRLFDDQHYASAVFEAAKLINNEIKELVRRTTGEEFDWVDLMNRAFSVKNPIILLGDLSTDTGKNLQQWYMDIYRGTMSAIRNPKWHENIQIDKIKAIHFLFLINLLFLKLEDQVILKDVD